MDEFRHLLLTKSKLESERKLMAARDRIPQANNDLQQAQLSLDKIKQQGDVIEKRRKELSEEIHSLNITLGLVHGLFAGGKK